MTAVELLPGSASSVPEAMRVMADAFDQAFGEAWTEAQLRASLQMPGSWLLLATDPEPVGFALSRTVVDEAELLLVGVRRDARRAGVGRRLVERVMQDACARCCGRLLLEVRSGNDAALGLYRALGFRQIGFRAAYYAAPHGLRHDAITMAMLLPRQHEFSASQPRAERGITL